MSGVWFSGACTVSAFSTLSSIYAEGSIVADGKQDTACNYVGGFRVATESLAWAGATAFKEAPLRPLLIGGAETGLFKTVGPLTWVEVDAAGHMVKATQHHV